MEHEGVVESLASPKIRIIDTVWDDSLRSGGQILAQQTNIALDAITGDWGFYLQGDEVVHERDLNTIVRDAEKYLPDDTVDGLLFHYFHFYGNYDYIAKPGTRGTYPFEVRMIKNDKRIRAFRDAQGFRKFSSLQSPGEKPERLWVKKTGATIYHYGKVRGPEAELQRSKDFHRLWHDDEWIDARLGEKTKFDYHPDYPLTRFEGTHPFVMRDRVNERNWNFEYDTPASVPLKDRILNSFTQLTGLRPFEFRNYRLRK
jgi:hypothetical protein